MYYTQTTLITSNYPSNLCKLQNTESRANKSTINILEEKRQTKFMKTQIYCCNTRGRFIQVLYQKTLAHWTNQDDNKFSPDVAF